MALQKQNAVFPMVKGIDTRTDPKQLVTGTMETLENAQLTSPGQYKKRFGYDKLASVDNPNGLGVLNNELVAFADNKVQSYSPGSDSFITAKVAPSPTTELDIQGLQLAINKGISNAESFVECDSAYHSSGRQAFVGYSSSTMNSYFSIIDYESNATLYAPTKYLSSTASQSKVFVVGGNFFIIYYTSQTLKYVAVPVNKTTGTLATAVTIATNLPASGRTFDGVVFNGILYLVWGTSGNDIGVASLDAFTLKTSIIPTGDAVTSTISITGDSTTGYLSVGYYNASAVKYLQIDILFNTIVPAAVVDTIASVVTVVLIVSNNAGYLYYEIDGSGEPSGAFYNNIIYRSTITAGVAAAASVFVRSVGIVSKPFSLTVNGDTVYCIMAGYTGAQPALGQGTVFIFNTSAVVIGKLSPGNCYGIGSGSQAATDTNSPVEVTAISSTKLAASFLRADFGYSESGVQYSSYGVYGVTYDFDSLEAYQNTSAANNLHVTNGILGMYDGQQYVEHGFNIIAEPPISATTAHTSPDNFPTTGTLSWIIVPEWIDAQGNFHQGTPSNAFAKSFTGPQTQFTLVIPTLRITQKDNVYLSVYRNTLAAPTIFNRISANLASAQLNTTAANSISVVDSITDAVVETHQQLYTTGGVVANYSVPSPKFVAGYRNRLVVLPSETPNILWISKNIVQGIPGVPVEFSAFLTIQVNTLGGDIGAFSQMDEKGIIFKKNTIFYFVGDGPSDTGANNDLSIPQQIPTDIGTTNQRSVLLMHDGIMFQSQSNGIFLLDRSLQVSYIGAQVEAYNNDTVISSQIIPNSTQVRFLLDSGVALVYDYIVKEWTVYTNHSGVDAVIYDGLYTYLSTDGKALQESESYADDTLFISMKLKTGWLSFSGIQGFQRIWKMLLLGTYYSAHQLQVSFAYDFNPNVVDTILINPGDLLDNDAYGSDATYGDSTPYGGDNGYPLDQFTFYNTIQKCESIQVTVQDFQSGNTVGQSFAISSLGFEIGVEGGLKRMPASRKFGA